MKMIEQSFFIIYTITTTLLIIFQALFIGFLIPVLRYSLLSFKYSSVHTCLNSSLAYQLLRQSFSAEFSFLHLTTIKREESLQHFSKSNTSLGHFSTLAFALINFGIITSISTFLRLLSSGSPVR